MKPVHVGCSGWVYKDWRGEFYPQKLAQRKWLEHYASVHETVEVNNTFYRLPTESTVRGWAEQTPDGFLFAVKGSRYFTHIKRLLQPEKYVDRFFAAIEPLADAGKLGPVLWQLPPTFKRDDERLATALKHLDSRPGRHCFEFRHESWFCDETYDALRDHDAALVIAHDPRSDVEQPRTITAEFTYVRFHFGERGRSGSYSESELATWARRIAAWRSRTEVFAYFNNDWEAIAPRNAARLRDSLR